KEEDPAPETHEGTGSLSRSNSKQLREQPDAQEKERGHSRESSDTWRVCRYGLYHAPLLCTLRSLNRIKSCCSAGSAPGWDGLNRENAKPAKDAKRKRRKVRNLR